MPVRALLTAALVDEAEMPNSGERWIADTQQRGFGLRLWASTVGPGKAFAVRTTDSSGRQFRRSLSAWSLYALDYWKFHEGERSLGAYLEEARKWARDELDRAKARPTLAAEELDQRTRRRSGFRKISLKRAGELTLERMEARGVSQAYRDRLDKLFSRHVPPRLQQKTILTVSEREILSVLSSAKLSIGNRRVLRPFLGQVLDLPSEFQIRGKTTSYHVRDLDLPRRQTKPERRKESYYAALFEFLEAEPTYWQQALCVRLYMEFRAPLSRLMKAKWSELADVRFIPRFGDTEPFWRREWRYADNLLGYEMISKRANVLILLALELCGRSYPNSEFWFPSGASASGHIRSVDHVWRLALAKVGWSYASLRTIRQEYHRQRPFYFRWDGDGLAYVPDQE